MRRAAVVALALAALPLAACGTSERERAEEQSAKSIAPVGVHPFSFKCESLTTLADVATAVGGTAAELMENMNEPPQGVAPPCNYRVTTATGDQPWFYAIDCRSSALDEAEILFQQYEDKNKKLIDGYNAASAADAGVVREKPKKVPGAPEVDAAPPPPPPTPASAVQVGKRGLDEGTGIIFVDDDAPCHVRVAGPGAEQRLALASLIARNLTEATAPMDPKFRRTIPKPK